MIRFKLNGAEREFEGDPETPLLWVLRDHVGLYGTKYGCGQALCGACTVHLNGKAIRSCVKRVRDVEGHDVTTIEGLSTRPDDVLPRPDGLDVPPQAATLHPLQQAWLEENVPQCGYCQSGQIMAAAALLKAKPNPTDTDIDVAMCGNLCRCGMYGRIRKAIHRAAGQV